MTNTIEKENKSPKVFGNLEANLETIEKQIQDMTKEQKEIVLAGLVKCMVF